MKKITIVLILFCLPFVSNSQKDSFPDLEACFTALIVKDIDLSIDWYSDVLRFKVLNKIESKERGFKQANLKCGNVLLELIELNSAVLAKDVVTNYSNKTRMVGIFKTGYLVSDFDTWMEHLKSKNVNFHGNVVKDKSSGKKMVIIKDPDGNRIQIFEK